LLRTVDDVRSGDIAMRLTSWLKDRPDRTKASAYTDCPVKKPTTAVTSRTRPPITK
jgi:hypothetical protein